MTIAQFLAQRLSQGERPLCAGYEKIRKGREGVAPARWADAGAPSKAQRLLSPSP
jgi:hypothetical protein